MKRTPLVKVLFIIICLLPVISYSQNVYNGFLQEFYLGRQPSAKAEALGRGLVAYPEYEFSSWYNPATIGLSEPVTVNGAYSNPFYTLDKASYNYIGVTANSGKYGAIGFNRYLMDYGETSFYLNGLTTASYTINYAYQPIKDFYTGINFNILSINRNTKELYSIVVGGPSPTMNLYPIDIGVLKIFQIQNTQWTKQKVSVGTSLYNINNVKYDFDVNQPEPLPVVLRFGASYNLQHTQRKGEFELRTINLYVYSEAEDLLNSKYFTTFRAGAEITSFEIFSARLGYFTQNLNNFGFSANLSEQHQFTYGFGLQLPITKITSGRFPVNVRFDYTSLPQPSYIPNTDWKNFNSYSISLRWEKPFFKF